VVNGVKLHTFRF